MVYRQGPSVGVGGCRRSSICGCPPSLLIRSPRREGKRTRISGFTIAKRQTTLHNPFTGAKLKVGVSLTLDKSWGHRHTGQPRAGLFDPA
ncbi:hypothetical protein RV134_290064 [Roseovarius sp. EC-HK134]|nr:hypothetical protein RV134_290064 [Roseovarius sp. EC-HK134]VVT18154.1 hypothetical protein RV420_360059 [Roseovarius sp. EC-SD190]